jgi:hypothetical protein
VISCTCSLYSQAPTQLLAPEHTTPSPHLPHTLIPTLPTPCPRRLQVIFCAAARTTLTGDLLRVEGLGVTNIAKALEVGGWSVTRVTRVTQRKWVKPAATAAAAAVGAAEAAAAFGECVVTQQRRTAASGLHLSPTSPLPLPLSLALPSSG